MENQLNKEIISIIDSFKEHVNYMISWEKKYMYSDEFLSLTQYKSSLIDFIHSELGLVDISKTKIISLLKEHKNIKTQIEIIKKGQIQECTYISFNSKINFSD